jgi:hypothetical protein
MKSLLYIILATTALISTTTTSAEEEPPAVWEDVIPAPAVPAPFGLTWGQKYNHQNCSTSRVKDSATVCEAKSVPKPVRGIESYMLIFVDKRLYKVTALGLTLYNDYKGNKAKEKYFEYKELLSKKYEGKLVPTAYEGINNEYMTFYGCLRTTSCGSYSTFWGVPDVDSVAIALEIKGLSSETSGYIQITYEHIKYSRYIDYIQGLNQWKTHYTKSQLSTAQPWLPMPGWLGATTRQLLLSCSYPSSLQPQSS